MPLRQMRLGRSDREHLHRLLATPGATIRGVAKILGLSSNTVRWHAFKVVMPACQCGKPSDHIGSCRYRRKYAVSKDRD